MEQACSLCTYHDPEDELVGLCRRNAPTSVVIGTRTDLYVPEYYWPEVAASDWCGEFQRARPAKLESRRRKLGE